ncbi:hypothetical protein EUGRSUZ_E03580 [Eucalyptus grandis]|uniref:Protein kinase domain-containing protein n=2 Tax=Eucalyptus grandis TaxID=71139 RepID=A0A059CA89_EUCGR|nr:hypothetical protein EUGRSUZ_E03580 [Eucalyptus grandis]
MDPSDLLLLLLLMFASTINAQFPATYCGSTGNFSVNSTYQTTLTTLLSSISTTNSSSLSYGFFNASATISGASQTLYVFGLCRGDLTAMSCNGCLDALASDMRRLCPLQKEALLYTGNCIIRYSNASFFGTVAREPTYVASTSADVSSPDTYDGAMRKLLNGLLAEAAGGGSLTKYASGNESAGPDMIYALVQCTPDLTSSNAAAAWFGKSDSTRTVMIVVFTSVSALLVISIVVVLLKVRRKKKQPGQIEGVHEISTAESLQFDFNTIRAATDNFSDSKKRGQGSFGAVYMGQLSNGQEIAVKRLSQNSSQGEVEFKNEVMLLARLQHRNLVRLLGFCLEGVEQLLIYEFVPNASLDQFIFDPPKRANLNWDRHHNIIMGVARGMLYLHEESWLRIIHRDLKASNILLDSNMNPKISDFGMARLFKLDQTQAETNRIVGTYGYMAPEYAMHGTFSIKLDVWKNWREGSISNIIDPSITSGSSTEIARCIHIGLLCVQEMCHSVTLQVPSRPAFYMHNNIESDMRSRNQEANQTSSQKTRPL